MKRRILSTLLALCLVLGMLPGTNPTVAQASYSGVDIWDGTVAKNYSGGNGTEVDPYQISNGAQLAKIGTETERKFFLITSDIYLNDTRDKDWYTKSVESLNKWKSVDLNGSIDGQGYSIYGLYGEGVFAQAGTVKNIRVKESFVFEGGVYDRHIGCTTLGTIAASATSILGCSNSGIVQSDANYIAVGGIVGYAENIDQCYNSGAVGATGNGSMVNPCIAGGIAAVARNISDCYNNGNISTKVDNYPAESIGGGIVGNCASNPATITACYNTGKITGNSGYGYYHADIVGIGSATLTNCYCLNKLVGFGVKSYTNFDIISSKVLTESEMKSQSSFEGFDFDNIWDIDPKKNDGYPILKKFANDFITHPGEDDPPVPGGDITFRSDDNFEVYVDDEITLLASISGINGFSANDIKWSSSNEDVATVRGHGALMGITTATADATVTGVSIGTTTITVTLPDGRSGSCEVTVKPASNIYYITAMDFGDLSINGSGTATAYFCVTDKDGNTLPNKTLQYELTGKSGITTVKTDKNGIFGITTPHLTNSATFEAIISSADKSVEIHNQGQFFDVEVKKLSYTQTWEGAYNLGGKVGVGPAIGVEVGPVELNAILAQGSLAIDLSKSISIEDDYNDGTRTLTLNCTNKGGDSLQLSSELNGKLKFLNAELGPGFGISGKVNLSQQAEAGLTIENYDPHNKEQLKRIGLYTVVPLAYTSSLFNNRIFQKLTGNICNTEAFEIDLGLTADVDSGKIDLSIDNIGGNVDSFGSYGSVWKWRDSYDYTGVPTFTTSKSLTVSAGGGIASNLETGDLGIPGDNSKSDKIEISTGGEIGEYAYGLNLSNSKEISATRPADSADFTSVSYKVYDDDENNYLPDSMVKDTYATVTYEGEHAKNIFAKDDDLVKWSKGKNPFIDLQDTLDNMFLYGDLASVKVATKYKEAGDYSFPLDIKAGLLGIGANFGVSGEHSFSWERASGALYNHTTYTTATSDADRSQIEPNLGGLDDLLLEAARSVFSDITQYITTKSGLASAGILSDALKVSGDRDWYVVVSTIKPESNTEERTIKHDESCAVITLLSEDDLTAFTSVGVPYEIAVYTDDRATTLVEDKELEESPLTLTLQYTVDMLESASADRNADIMLLRYDAQNDVYVRVESAVQDKNDMTITADMERSGEYILAVDSVDYPTVYTVTFDPADGTVTPTTATTGTDGKLTTLPVPVYDGYTFDGWYTAADGGEKVDENEVYTEDTTLYAHWTKIDTPPTPEHTHNWAADWSSNATHHWHECTASGCPVTVNSDKDGYGVHIYDDAMDATCNTCGYTRTVTPPTETDERTYYISIPQFSGGEITPSAYRANRSERVTLYARPDAGYELDSITVKDARGRTLTLRDMGGNAYSFSMPDARVTVDASFVQVQSETAPADDEPFTGLGTPGVSGIVLNPAAIPFADVSAGHWFYNSVDYVWKHYLMSGVSDNRFSPDTTTSRAMIWTILARMNNVRTDINPGSTWYEKGMLWAKEQGVTDGTNPMAEITREQLATMLWRNAGSPGAPADLNQFSDSGSVSNYALSAMQWAVANGIVNGTDGKLNPQGTATRAQVAAMVMRYGERIGA